MEGSPTNLKSTLEDWLERNFPSGYTSCIKINGRPILPPLMTEDRRMEMRHLRDLAIEVENRMTRRKGSVAQDESAGGEAMYEGNVEELHFANSLPSSLAAYAEDSLQPIDHTALIKEHPINQGPEQALFSQPTSDMLNEFDPLAEKNNLKSISPLPLLDINSGDFAGKITRTGEETASKPSSAESSVALSYSTDLNNYMDITEASADVSVPGSDVKSAGEAGDSTPSTVRPDSADSKFLSTCPKRDGKTTYEDLNNYLDSLLNNSTGSKKGSTMKDGNQNVVTSSTSPPSSRNTSPPILPEGSKMYSDLPPLRSPQECLQTRIVTDNHYFTSASQKNTNSIETSSNFLQNCALSPVGRNDVKDSYEQKVQLYLQNLLIDEGKARESSRCSSSQHPSNLEQTRKEPILSQNLLNGDALLLHAEENLNCYGSVPPRLVRSNSYTLDSPSPMLLAHMEAELKKNTKNEAITGEKTVLQSTGSSRRVWDVNQSKNMPSWCTRQPNPSHANSKSLSPKKVLNRSISAQPSRSEFLRSEVPADVANKQLKAKLPLKYSTDQAQTKKMLIAPSQKEVGEKTQGLNSVPSVNEVSTDKLRILLLQLQLQHNQEMEELVIRQRKQKEAIRLALLEEQRANEMKSCKDNFLGRDTSHPLGNPLVDPSSQSPPTKDEVLSMEKKNSSPTICEKGDVQNNNASSISLENASKSKEKTNLVDLNPPNDERLFDKAQLPHNLEVDKDAQRERSSSVSGSSSNQYGLLNKFNSTSGMNSSYPPVDRPCSSQLDSMTSSLPPEILSLQFPSTESTSESTYPVSCIAPTSLVSSNNPATDSADITSYDMSVLPSTFALNLPSGSPHSKRRSWCSRQLFPDDDITQSHPDWVTQSHKLLENQAAARIQAGVRGYLTRRLLKTERVQNCITTIRDTIVCALQLQRECAPHVEPSDLQLHGRLIQQLSAACEDLHNMFMGLPVGKRMAIIAADRERLRVRTPRSRSSTGSRPLSRATQIALQRKMNQTDPSDSSSVHSRASSANRSRRRSWAPVESRTGVRTSALSASVANTCEVVSGCLSRSSAPVSLPLQRSASAGSSRKPWR